MALTPKPKTAHLNPKHPNILIIRIRCTIIIIRNPQNSFGNCLGSYTKPRNIQVQASWAAAVGPPPRPKAPTIRHRIAPPRSRLRFDRAGMYVYIHTYLPTYIRTYIHTYIYIYIHIYIYILICSFIYLYLYLYLYFYLFVFIYICMYIDMYVYISYLYMCMCICIYTHIRIDR